MSGDPLAQFLFRNNDPFADAQRGKVILLDEFVHAGGGDTQQVGQLLWDCLNEHYWFWEDGREPDDLDFKDEDYCNEYGFVIKNERGNYSFYNQRFLPDHRTLESNDADTVLMIRETNAAVCELFDAFITLVQDLLRVQNAYSDLLDNYINGKSKFLTDTELANCFSAYLRATERKPMTDRVVSSNSMQMSHEVYRRPDGREKLCEAYTFDSLGAFLYFDFFRGLSQSYLPKRCDNCGMYFLLEGGKYSNYCERPLKDDPDKTCRYVGARKKYDDKCKRDPIWLAYNRAYKAHYARYMKKKMTVSEFEEWSRQAVVWRIQAEQGKLKLTEYEILLKK